MSKKIIKDEFVKGEKLKHFGFKVYETVELGEKPKKLEKIAEMEYTPGEVEHTIGNFDDDIEMGRAVIVQDREVNAQKYAPKQFSEADLKAIKKESEPEPEPEAEPEPEIPAITEEDLNKARNEARQAGLEEGKKLGHKAGKEESDRRYEAEKADYMKNLEATYKQVISSVQTYKDAVSQLDDSLPDMLISMVRDIVGEERKINDNIVASIARKSLSHLRELEKVVFLVHPDDVDSMKGSFPDYETKPDKSVIKGSLKVSTNIGEMNFSIERLLSEFVERIHEEFSPTEEG
ncbi:MAG: hypothetical protein C0602_07370 [Denitrovibrio sp.]|nr:MAG: hypothetical protein C0602_07370 [Denitrovibrio sp.]